MLYTPYIAMTTINSEYDSYVFSSGVKGLKEGVWGYSRLIWCLRVAN